MVKKMVISNFVRSNKLLSLTEPTAVVDLGDPHTPQTKSQGS